MGSRKVHNRTRRSGRTRKTSRVPCSRGTTIGQKYLTAVRFQILQTFYKLLLDSPTRFGIPGGENWMTALLEMLESSDPKAITEAHVEKWFRTKPFLRSQFRELIPPGTKGVGIFSETSLSSSAFTMPCRRSERIKLIKKSESEQSEMILLDSSRSSINELKLTRNQTKKASDKKKLVTYARSSTLDNSCTKGTPRAARMYASNPWSGSGSDSDISLITLNEAPTEQVGF